MKCPYDGCSYESSEKGIKQHHSRTHGESLTLEQNECEYCGSCFTSKQKDDQRFCSHECYSNHLSENQTGTDHPNYSKVQETCDQCDSQFERAPSKMENYDHSFCSEECKYEWLSSYLSEERKGDGNPMFGVTGEDHPNYTGFERDYGHGWGHARELAINRDDEQCRICGTTRDEHERSIGRDLEVHHIEPMREFDEPEEAHSLDNLITMCKRCHIELEHSHESKNLDVLFN